MEGPDETKLGHLLSIFSTTIILQLHQSMYRHYMPPHTSGMLLILLLFLIIDHQQHLLCGSCVTSERYTVSLEDTWAAGIFLPEKTQVAINTVSKSP